MKQFRGLSLLLISLELLCCIQGASVGEGIIRKIASGLQNAVLQVRTCGRPEINNIMHNLTVRPGETARFRCTVDMKCMVSYIQWYHEMNNGTMRLLKTAATNGNPYSFVLEGVSEMDEGFYTCVAGNILGETISSAYLQVSQGPQASKPCLLILAACQIFLLALAVGDEQLFQLSQSESRAVPVGADPHHGQAVTDQSALFSPQPRSTRERAVICLEKSFHSDETNIHSPITQ